MSRERPLVTANSGGCKRQPGEVELSILLITNIGRSHQLIAREAGNFELPAHPGVIIKDSYWRRPQRNLAGNTIGFFVQVLGLTLHKAMREITAVVR